MNDAKVWAQQVWSLQSGENMAINIQRWQPAYINKGWDMNDVKAEFDDFWQLNDPKNVQMDKLVQQIQAMMMLLGKGMSSGRVSDAKTVP